MLPHTGFRLIKFLILGYVILETVAPSTKLPTLFAVKFTTDSAESSVAIPRKFDLNHFVSHCDWIVLIGLGSGTIVL